MLFYLHNQVILVDFILFSVELQIVKSLSEFVGPDRQFYDDLYVLHV